MGPAAKRKTSAESPMCVTSGGYSAGDSRRMVERLSKRLRSAGVIPGAYRVRRVEQDGIRHAVERTEHEHESGTLVRRLHVFLGREWRSRVEEAQYDRLLPRRPRVLDRRD